MNDRDITNFGRGFRHRLFTKLISIEHLHTCWNEFKRGKEHKLDVQEFSNNLEDNLFELQGDLSSEAYCHSGYTQFYITDTKLRSIHKPAVRDRVLHHALVQLLEPMYEPLFIFDSYSSRKDKGTLRAIDRLREFAWKESCHNSQMVWVLKCDIRKFFDSVDHQKLLGIIKKTVKDEKVLNLLEQVITSFETYPGRGIPLGNLTSQLFSNVYFDLFDQFIKRKLRVRYYLRYADDFALVSKDRAYLESLIPLISEFLKDSLGLELHTRKVIFRKWRQGVDFLGYVIFPHHTLLRSHTHQRILKKVAYRSRQLVQGKISSNKLDQSLTSFYGILHHCRGNGVFGQIEDVLEKFDMPVK